MKSLLISVFKFGQVSGLSTVVDFGLGYFLVTFLHQNATLSTFFGNILGGMLAYFLCKNWVFPTENSNDNLKTVVKFTSINLGNLAMNTAGVWLFTKYVDANYLTIRALVGSLVFIIYSYTANRWFVFRQSA
jgi:putative flippase GtrA